ncbi:ATP-binding protein [Anthocerotibacter panamensis]|uniref:ATP-binding protein n=1 Tax=Anthocerotibacter panamensis TaxID=2857077 RepID=UPI001C402517|nr:ATP-binding protein [Anthocerotibacter panamensis]
MNIAVEQAKQESRERLGMAVLVVRQMLERYIDQIHPPPPTPVATAPAPGVLAPTAADLQPIMTALQGLRQGLQETLDAFEPAPLVRLCRAFGLSPFERNILLLGVAQELFPDAARLFAMAQGQETVTYPTIHLALQVLPDGDWSAFAPEAPLSYWQLLEVSDAPVLSLSPLTLDPSILFYLLDEPYHDRQLADLLKPLPLAPSNGLQPSHQRLADQLATPWLRTHDPYPVVQLCGDDLAAKRAIVRAACTQAGWSLLRLALPAPAITISSFQALRRRIERAALLTKSVLLLDCDQLNAADSLTHQLLGQLVEQVQTPCLITSRDRYAFAQRPLVTYDVPQLTADEQRAVWQTALGPIASALNGQVEALVAQFNLGAPAIQVACTQALNQFQAAQNPDDLPIADFGAALWTICRMQARPRLDDLAQHITAQVDWEDLVLPRQQSNILREIAAHVHQRTTVYRSWGFAGRSGRGLGITALFYGVSGTGKTTAAEVLSTALNLDLYRIDLSQVVSKYLGETEKNLRQVFNAAEEGGVILLFDEADALFGKRTEVKDSHDRHANVEVSYLLQRMEAYQGLAILTTNMKSALDNAFQRRIRFVVEFPFPDATQRAELWRRVFPKAMPQEGLNVQQLAQLSVSGGSIRNIALNAAFIAADTGEPVMMKHILVAARSEYIKLGKGLTDAEIKGWL